MKINGHPAGVIVDTSENIPRPFSNKDPVGSKIGNFYSTADSGRGYTNVIVSDDFHVDMSQMLVHFPSYGLKRSGGLQERDESGRQYLFLQKEELHHFEKIDGEPKSVGDAKLANYLKDGDRNSGAFALTFYWIRDTLDHGGRPNSSMRVSIISDEQSVDYLAGVTMGSGQPDKVVESLFSTVLGAASFLMNRENVPSYDPQTYTIPKFPAVYQLPDIRGKTRDDVPKIPKWALHPSLK
jgi:hypothetical protein